MSQSLTELKARVARITRLAQAAGLLGWDQQTYMPTGAANARAEQMATLSEFSHELFVSEEVGNLIAKAETETAGMDADSDEVRTVRGLRRDYDRATKLPTELVAEIARHETLAQEIWVKARAANDFASFAPALEKMYDLMRQKAEAYGYTEHIYDALIDQFEQGMTRAHAAKMFAEMKPYLVELTQAIASSKNPVDDTILHGSYPVEKQRELTLSVVKAIGYDLNRGRQDEAAHPFCANFSRDDVRITTRFHKEFFNQALYASLHEAGHAMYEQGSPEKWEGTVLAGGVSLGVHESQSRLWENQVGRSRAFCGWVFPQVQAAFPDAFGSVTAEDFYRAVNKVAPSFIRVEADEVTYNLHTLLRFEMECDLLTGQLAVKDVPEVWNTKTKAYFGITPDKDADGCLQDIHWSCGLIGYFPTYSIGNLLSAQLFHAAGNAISGLETKIGQGEFTPLRDWLRTNVHAHANKFQPGEVIQKATGEPLTAKYYTQYLTAKYSDIYRL